MQETIYSDKLFKESRWSEVTTVAIFDYCPHDAHTVEMNWVRYPDSVVYFRHVHQEITLPVNFTCDRCVLQLLSQAGEWTAPSGGYVF